MGCKPSVLLYAQLHPLPTYQRMGEDFLFKSLWWELFRLVPVRRKDYTDSKFPQSFSWPKSAFLHRLTIFLKKAEPPLTLKHLLSLSQCQWGTIWVIFWLNSIFFFFCDDLRPAMKFLSPDVNSSIYKWEQERDAWSQHPLMTMSSISSKSQSQVDDMKQVLIDIFLDKILCFCCISLGAFIRAHKDLWTSQRCVSRVALFGFLPAIKTCGFISVTLRGKKF